MNEQAPHRDGIAGNAGNATEKQIKYIWSLRRERLGQVSNTKSSRPTVTAEQTLILEALRNLGPMTDSEIESHASLHLWPHAHAGYYRRRRSELKDLDMVDATNERRKNQAGNSESVWQARATTKEIVWAMECSLKNLTSRTASQIINILRDA